MTHRIFLVEDHPVMREGYASLLNAEPDLAVCAVAASAEEAFGIAADLTFDLAIVDLSLPGVNGVELVKRLRALDPDVQVLVVSGHDESLYAERVMQAGARGYLMKHESAPLFVSAVRTVLDGGVYLSEAMRARFLSDRLGRGTSDSGLVASLTDRELEVFDQFGQGKSTHEVADALGLSHKTIESHRVNIKRKLGITSAAEFLKRAVLWVESPIVG